MSQVTSPKNPSRKVPEIAARMCAYVAVAVFVQILFYRLEVRSLFAIWVVIPVAAEPALFSRRLGSGSYLQGVAFRFLGLAVAQVIVHFAYVIPVVYKGVEPFAGEGLWAAFNALARTCVAIVVLAGSRYFMNIKSR
jgi:hypothetical protein